MTYIPSKSLRKAIGSVRIVHTGSGAATLYVDNAVGVPITFTLGVWTQIFASSASVVKAIEIFDSSGEIGQVGVGAASSEVLQFRVLPGGNGLNYFQIDDASRITLRYESALPPDNSETDINFYK